MSAMQQPIGDATLPAVSDAAPLADHGTDGGTTTLVWKNLSYSIPDKKAPEGKKVILHPQSGYVAPGDLLAIMGPSGSGKTSLLNSLAGRLPVVKGAVHTGTVEVNQVSKQDLPCPFADISAYVEQEDALFPLSTVQETLHFSAKLRLPSSTPVEEREKRIEHVLRHVGLLHTRGTRVGGNSFNGALRGLSGGERKRLSIAIELLHKPKCIFLDEPTTGLDSYQALNVITKLQELAKEGHTITISIHQPRSSIFAMFSRIYLLAAGKPVFAGALNDATTHFEGLGFPLPQNFSPADYFIDLVSVDQRDDEQQKFTADRLASLQDSWTQAESKGDKLGGDENDPFTRQTSHERRKSILEARPQKPAGQYSLVTPFCLLMVRAFREQMRDSVALFFKTVFAALTAVIFGLVYWQLEMDQTSIQNRSGLLFFLTMNQAFGSTITTAQVIPRQLAVVQRERANRMYAIFPYYISNLVVMVPLEALPVFANSIVAYYMADMGGSFWIFVFIMFLETICAVSLGMALSASFKSVTMAPQLAPAAVIIFLVFNGFMINEESIPDYFIWMREISFIRYAFKAVMVNEFKDAAFKCNDVAPGATCITNGNTVLSQFGFDDEGAIGYCIIILVILAVAFNVLAFGILILRRPSFLPLKEAVEQPTLLAAKSDADAVVEIKVASPEEKDVAAEA